MRCRSCCRRTGAGCAGKPCSTRVSRRGGGSCDRSGVVRTTIWKAGASPSCASSATAEPGGPPEGPTPRCADCPGSHLGGPAGPVRVAEDSLDELACRVAGEVVVEGHLAGHLVVREPSAAEGDH